MLLTKTVQHYIYFFSILFGASFSCFAQDSIFSISFGTGATPDSKSPLNPSDGTTSLIYSTNTTSPGSYTLVPNPRSFFPGYYHSGEDHTPGDINGNMMLLDVHTQGSTIYKKEVIGLCTKTKYEFSAWIANLEIPSTSANKSRATFNIRNSKNNSIIATATSRTIPQSSVLTWEKVSIIFTIPDPSINSITLEIVSGIDGINHTAYDDILFEALKPNIDISNSNPFICAGENVEMECTVEPNFYSKTAVYQWQKKNSISDLWENIPGATNSKYIAANIEETTEYRMLVSELGNIENTKCRSASGVNKVTVYPRPTATVIGTTEICQNDTAPEIIFTGIGGKAPYTFTYTLNGILHTISTLNNTDVAKIVAPTDALGSFVFELKSVKDADNKCERNFCSK